MQKRYIVDSIISDWNNNAKWVIDDADKPHEENSLKLDCTKAKTKLGWSPKWNIDISLEKTIEWYKSYFAKKDMLKITQEQIITYVKNWIEIAS